MADILAYWVNQCKLRKNEELNEMRYQRDSALIQRCFMMWRMKLIQLMKCDQYYQEKQCQK